MNTRKMPKAYSYVRFSTALQAQGDSLRRQTELSSQYAAKKGLFLDTSLTLFDKGLSGFTGENRTKGALAVFLHAVKTGIVEPGSYLLVESLDRLSRDTISEQMTLFMQLINSDIIVVTLADEQVYSKETINTDLSRLMMSLVIMMRAHDESVMKSRRLKAVWESKRRTVREEKLTGQCPAWLTLNADRKSFTIIEQRADIVRRIYQMSIDGMGHQSIAKTLNTEGLPAWGDRGKKFVAADIQDLPLFVVELRRRENALSVYLCDRLTESTRQLLEAFSADAAPGPLTEALVQEFTAIIRGSSIYDPTRFDAVKVSAQTQYLVRAINQDRDEARLNRLLLEDAYPRCIRRRYTGWHFSYVRYLLRTKAVLGEYQPHRRERGIKRRSIPVGESINNYYPAVVQLFTWQRAPIRTKTGTPGRIGARVSSLFGGLIFDGDNDAPMRFVSKRPRPDAQGVRHGRWHYLISDYGRMKKGAKAASWRYEWFQDWFLDYMIRLDWSSVAKEQAPTEELAAKRKMAAQQAALDEIASAIGRLMELARSTSKPPTSLLSEIAKLDDEKLTAENSLRQMEREVEALADHRSALSEAGDKIRELVTNGDEGSRLRLREEIRRKVRRIDVFPNGVLAELLQDYPLNPPNWPSFRIVFVNGASRWIFCPDKNPAGFGPHQAPTLDTNLPPEWVPKWETEEQNQPSQEMPNAPSDDCEECSGQHPEKCGARVDVITKESQLPSAVRPAQLDMALNEEPQKGLTARGLENPARLNGRT